MKYLIIALALMLSSCSKKESSYNSYSCTPERCNLIMTFVQEDTCIKFVQALAEVVSGKLEYNTTIFMCLYVPYTP